MGSALEMLLSYMDLIAAAARIAEMVLFFLWNGGWGKRLPPCDFMGGGGGGWWVGGGGFDLGVWPRFFAAVYLADPRGFPDEGPPVKGAEVAICRRK